MNRIASGLSVVMLLAFAAGCQSSAAIEADARNVADRYTEALLKNDIPELEKLWGDDLIFVNPRGQVQTKAMRLADARSGANTFKSIERQDTFTKSSGNHVLLFTRGKISGQYSGKETSGDYRIMMAMSRHGSAWSIHAIQMTPITP